MPDITVQPIAFDQWESAWELRLRALRDHPDAFGQPWETAASLDPEQVRQTIATFWTGGDNQVFVAVAPDETLAGMTGLAREPRQTEHHRAKVWGVYVAPEARGNQLAGRLLTAAIEWARSRDGVLQVHIDVNSANLPAIRAYERAGFQRTGRTPRARILDGVPIDHDEMVLILDGYDSPAEKRTKGRST